MVPHRRLPAREAPAWSRRMRDDHPATLHLGSAVLALLGPVEVAATDRGLCAVALPRWNDHDLRLQPWQAAGFTPSRGRHALVDQALAELRAFAQKRCLEFSVPLDLRHLPEFTARVLKALLKVPAGGLTPYRRPAAQGGPPGGARAG